MKGNIDDLPLRIINKYLETPELFEKVDNFKKFFRYYEKCSKVIRSTYSPAYLLKQLCLNENMNIFQCYQKYGTSASRRLFMISCMLNKCVLCIRSRKIETKYKFYKHFKLKHGIKHTIKTLQLSELINNIKKSTIFTNLLYYY